MKRYVTFMFLFVMLAFGATMTIVIKNGRDDNRRARQLAITQAAQTRQTAVTLALSTAKSNWVTSSLAYKNCQSIEDIKTSVRVSTDKALKNLDSIEYYKTHENELIRAREDLLNQNREFAADECVKPVKPKILIESTRFR